MAQLAYGFGFVSLAASRQHLRTDIDSNGNLRMILFLLKDFQTLSDKSRKYKYGTLKLYIF